MRMPQLWLWPYGMDILGLSSCSWTKTRISMSKKKYIISRHFVFLCRSYLLLSMTAVRRWSPRWNREIKKSLECSSPERMSTYKTTYKHFFLCDTEHSRVILGQRNSSDLGTPWKTRGNSEYDFGTQSQTRCDRSRMMRFELCLMIYNFLNRTRELPWWRRPRAV